MLLTKPEQMQGLFDMESMPKLHKRSDGACETPSGLFAVVPKYTSGIVDDISWFEFRSDFQSPVTRVEWQTGSALILLPQDQAKAMVRMGYADGISDNLLAQYNDAADEWNASAAKARAKPALPVQPPAVPLNMQPAPAPDPTPAKVVPAEKAAPAPPPAQTKGGPVDNAT